MIVVIQTVKKKPLINEVPIKVNQTIQTLKPAFYLILTRKEWLEARKGGVGASEIDSVLGRNPYTKPEDILKRKLGIKEVFTPDAIARMRAGQIFEPTIIHLYALKTGLQIESKSLKDKLYYDPENPFLLASLDGMVTRKDGTKYLIDAKYSKAKFWQECKTEYYYGQAQQQMYLLDLYYHEFVVLNPDIEDVTPESLIIVPTVRDDKFIKDILIPGAKEFWQTVINRKKELEK